jgi:catechol 2,3-dioxygenase-like lactoylglutathione lyase family enzyme
MIKDVRHVGIMVSDMEKSLKFYRDLLGLKVKSLEDEEGEFLDNMLAHENVKNKVAKLYAKNGNALIELIDSRSYANKKDRDFFTIGASHFSLTVDDLEKTYDYLVKNGVKFTAPPQQTPDRFAKVTFCEDPDGTPIELVEVINTD